MARKGLPAKYAKMGFKKGWRAYKASKGKRSTKRSKSRSSKSKPRGRKKVTRRRGSRIFGNLSFKGMLVATAALSAAKYVSKRFVPLPPRYINGISMVGASFIPISGTKGLRSAGIVDMASEFVSDMVLGGLPSTATQRGYEL